MHFLYANQVTDAHLDSDQRRFLAKLSGNSISDGASLASHASRPKDFNSAQDWVTAFFDKGAEEVLGYYADDFVWEDIEFMQTITTKEELYKAFVVFNNSGPDSPFGVHRNIAHSVRRSGHAVGTTGDSRIALLENAPVPSVGCKATNCVPASYRSNLWKARDWPPIQSIDDPTPGSPSQC